MSRQIVCFLLDQPGRGEGGVKVEVNGDETRRDDNDGNEQQPRDVAK